MESLVITLTIEQLAEILKKSPKDNQFGYGPLAELVAALVQVRRCQETSVASVDSHSIS